jgi:hypothetical protein
MAELLNVPRPDKIVGRNKFFSRFVTEFVNKFMYPPYPHGIAVILRRKTGGHKNRQNKDDKN